MSRSSWAREGAVAVIRRDASIYFSYRLRTLSQLLLALFSLTLFYYLSRLVGVRRFPSPDAYFAYVVVGLAVLHSLTATLAQLPQSIRTELVAGTFERVATSPLGPAAAVAAMTVFPALAAAAVGAVTILMAVVLFGFEVAGPQGLLAVPVGLVALLSFLPFSLLVAAVVLVSKQAGAVGNLVVIGLSLAGGVYYPPQLMPAWIRWVSDVQPFTPALELLRHLLTGAPTTDPPWVELARLVGFAAIAGPLAYWLLSASIAACRRRGTLIEY